MLHNGGRLLLTGRVRWISINMITGLKKYGPWMKNLVPTVGQAAIARRIGGIGLKSNEGQVTYGAVGTDPTSPVISDTILGAELARKVIAYSNLSGNEITIRTFFTTSEAVGTLREFGLFGEDASASADSGTLMERVVINKTKTNSETLTIESVISVEGS